MKKFLTPFFACALAAAFATVSFAMTRGTIVLKDEYYDDEITRALPGQTVYIALSSEPSSSKDIPTKAYLFEAETINSDDGDDDKLFGTNANKSYTEKGSGGRQLDVVKKEIDDDEYWYFGVLEIKDVKEFPADGYDVFPGVVRVTRKNGDIFKVTPKIDGIGYEEGDDEMKEEPLSFSFEQGDDVELSFPDGGGRLVGVAKKDFVLVAGMETDDISSITRRYPDASLTFFLGNGASLTSLRSPKLYFEGNEDDYLYEINNSNTLTNKTSTYDDDEGCFVVSTNTLGKYLLSDTRLTSTGSSSSSKDEDEDDDDDDDDDYDDYDDVIPPSVKPVYPDYATPVNPSTGAKV